MEWELLIAKYQGSKEIYIKIPTIATVATQVLLVLELPCSQRELASLGRVVVVVVVELEVLIHLSDACMLTCLLRLFGALFLLYSTLLYYQQSSCRVLLQLARVALLQQKQSRGVPQHIKSLPVISRSQYVYIQSTSIRVDQLALYSTRLASQSQRERPGNGTGTHLWGASAVFGKMDYFPRFGKMGAFFPRVDLGK